jgi:hypothetical protein
LNCIFTSFRSVTLHSTLFHSPPFRSVLYHQFKHSRKINSVWPPFLTSLLPMLVTANGYAVVPSSYPTGRLNIYFPNPSHSQTYCICFPLATSMYLSKWRRLRFFFRKKRRSLNWSIHRHNALVRRRRSFLPPHVSHLRRRSSLPRDQSRSLSSPSLKCAGDR